jgi:hypothetical protein
MGDNKIRCGYRWFATDKIFKWLGTTDPMLPACTLHDALYDNAGSLTRKQVDDLFLRRMLVEATTVNSSWMKAQAYVYYGLARAFGWLVW